MKNTFISLLLLVTTSTLFAQSPPLTFSNPILPGYHPDPSICRVGDDYYLVNSTFVWFPGLPVYHSRDLVNWQLIGHAIDRPGMVDFEGLPDMLGLFAPTIRYHDGVFYIINTCVGCGMNFYVTATNPAGPWSDPVWLPDAPGIDPSLMWDDDGRCYYTGVVGPESPAWLNQGMIFNQELDVQQGKLVGERHLLTYGHANNASYSEGPHLYKINGNYLLLISEGGTEMYHALTAHHSDSINGPYHADYINPVVTHRHLGSAYPVQAIGHGDLVQTQNGEWWSVLLGKRVISSYTTLGRETFLAKVEFEGRTPIFNAGEGKVLASQTRPDLPWTPVGPIPATDEFDGSSLPIYWYTNRTPTKPFYTVGEGAVNLQLRKQVLDSLTHSSLLFRRVEHHRFVARTKLTFSTKRRNEQAGIALYRTNENYYTLLKEKEALVLYQSFKGEKKEVARVAYTAPTVYLQVEVKDLEIQFKYGQTLHLLQPIGAKQSMIVLADLQGNALFNGPGIGMYATSNGADSRAKAQFDWFNYTSADSIPSRIIEEGGTGAYSAIMHTEASLPGHTIFRPATLPSSFKLPLIVWGNGACFDSPLEHVNFLNEIASHGYLVIAIGTMPEEGGERIMTRSTSAKLLEAVDWAIRQNTSEASPYYNRIDCSNIAVSGMSCGGLQALEVAGDKRFKTVVICNSGVLGDASTGHPMMPGVTKNQLNKLHSPTLYILGGESDIAYANGMDDYKRINHVPIVMTNLNVGHGGTYSQPHGGDFARVATAWFNWQLKGDRQAARLFTGEPAGLTKWPGWKIESKNVTR